MVLNQKIGFVQSYFYTDIIRILLHTNALFYQSIVDLKTIWSEIKASYYEGSFNCNCKNFRQHTTGWLKKKIDQKGRPLACSHKGSLVHDEILRKNFIKFYPFPVRCLKDNSWKVATDDVTYLLQSHLQFPHEC